MHEAHAKLQVVAESNATKLERMTLQLDGSQNELSDLQRTNEELKRANGEIKRQLDKWQNLETKGGAEVEALRKQRLDLEVQVKTLEGRLEKTREEHARVQEKDKSKLAKLKQNMTEWEVRCLIIYSW